MCRSFSNERRVAINEGFWSLDSYNRKLFVCSQVSRGAQVKRRHLSLRSPRHILNYTLKGEHGIVSVCQAFFLNTLGFQKNNNTFVRNCFSDTSEFPEKDKRGVHTKFKSDVNLIKKHIETFNPTSSHYRRSHAPHRRYLPTDITIFKMHSAFNEAHSDAKCSYDVYRKIVDELNISFTKLGHEECEICKIFEIHKVQEHSKDDFCDECADFDKHKHHYELTRAEYILDKKAAYDPKKVVVSADLQKVIMLPRMDQFKQVIFTKRIVVFNQSFVPLGIRKENVAVPVVWHEATTGRKKEDLISTYHMFMIHHRDAKEFLIWCDNCTSQNKNWALFSFLAYIINSDEIRANQISIKYLDKGHTYMSADSFHHQVELSMKHQHKNILYDFHDFVNAVQSANKGRVVPIVPSFTDFSYWPDLSSKYKLNKANRPYISDISKVVFKRGSFKMEYSDNFQNDLNEFCFLNSTSLKNGIKKAVPRTEARGIPNSTKEDIVRKLLKLMPINRHLFWNELDIQKNENKSED